MTDDLIPLLRDACKHLETLVAKVTDDSHKRRIVRTITKLERYVAETADANEAVL